MSKYVSTDNIETIVDLLLQNDKEIKTNADTQVSALSEKLDSEMANITITDEQYTAMMEEIFGGQLGSGGGSVGTTTTITDEQVTAGMNEIFGEGNWSE